MTILGLVRERRQRIESCLKLMVYIVRYQSPSMKDALENPKHKAVFISCIKFLVGLTDVLVATR